MRLNVPFPYLYTGMVFIEHVNEAVPCRCTGEGFFVIKAEADSNDITEEVNELLAQTGLCSTLLPQQ